MIVGTANAGHRILVAFIPIWVGTGCASAQVAPDSAGPRTESIDAFEHTERVAALGAFPPPGQPLLDSSGTVVLDGCIATDGAPVLTVIDAELQASAMATLRPAPDYSPIILINRDSFARMDPVLQAWLYHHECAHHLLGHVGIPREAEMENDANCWATMYLLDTGKLQWEEVETLLEALENAAPVPGRPDPGHEADALRQCLLSAPVRPNPMRLSPSKTLRQRPANEKRGVWAHAVSHVRANA